MFPDTTACVTTTLMVEEGVGFSRAVDSTRFKLACCFGGSGFPRDGWTLTTWKVERLSVPCFVFLGLECCFGCNVLHSWSKCPYLLHTLNWALRTGQPCVWDQ